MLNISVMIDVDNKERFNLNRFVVGEAKKGFFDAMADYRSGITVVFDIKNLGILQIDGLIPSYKDKLLIIKTSLILDYRQLTDKEAEVSMW